jgi:DNA-binding response OmpR family regulator
LHCARRIQRADSVANRAPDGALIGAREYAGHKTRAGRVVEKASAGPIFLLVSANIAQLAFEANEMVADKYLMKPVNPAVLVVKTMARLGHSRRAQRAQQPLMR